MSARPIGSASISFGLVSVPVKLYSSSQPSSGLSFNLLHGKCGSRLRQQYVCQKDGEVVERDDMVKGYEFAKDRYVTFTSEELKALEEASSGAIEVREFVPLGEVGRIFLDKTFYLGPDKGGERAYRLFSEALRRTGRAALGRYAARGRQNLVLVRPIEGGLAMEQLHHAAEIRSFAEVPLGNAEVKDAELRLAVELVEQSSAERFAPEAYEDEVRKRTLEAIQRKVEGQEITAAPAEEPQARIIDLMEALKASLAKGAKAASGDRAGRKPPRRAGKVASPPKTAAGRKAKRA